MQDDYHIPDEEAEQKFEEDLDRWGSEPLNEPLYMQADDIKYLQKPTDAGAKVLWLKYTKLGRPIPDYVIERMVEIFESDVKKRPKSRLIPEPLSNTVFPLIRLALSGNADDLMSFWKVLHCPADNTPLLSVQSNIADEVLSEARKTFPVERLLADIELFKFAAKILGLYETNYEEKPEELARRRYKTYMKSL